MDEWAKRQNCAVAEPERIRYVSGALLAGQRVCYAADWAVSGTPPAGVEPAAAADRADFALTLTPTGEALHLIPRIAVLGSAASAARRRKVGNSLCGLLRGAPFCPAGHCPRSQH